MLSLFQGIVSLIIVLPCSNGATPHPIPLATTSVQSLVPKILIANQQLVCDNKFLPSAPDSAKAKFT